MFLNTHELYELTGRRRRDAQAKVLKHIGILHKIRPDGSIAVHKTHVDKVFGGVAEQKDKVKISQPHWEAIC